MELNPLPSHDRQVVQGYAKGGFRVSDTEWWGAILIFPTRTILWPVASVIDLVPSAFEPVRDAADPPIELLLIGTGQKIALLSSKLRQEIRAMGFAVEVMDTGAACRTYNVLIGEERRVAAALLPMA